MPTLKNSQFFGTHPVWDLSSIFTAAETSRVSGAAFPDDGGYPTKSITSLATLPGSSIVFPPKDFIPKVKAGSLPQIC